MTIPNESVTLRADVRSGRLYLKTYWSMAESSFDVVSSVDLQEVKNAIGQATKELDTRYDLKGTGSNVELQGEGLLLTSSDEFKLKAVRDAAPAERIHRCHWISAGW